MLSISVVEVKKATGGKLKPLAIVAGPCHTRTRTRATEGGKRTSRPRLRAMLLQLFQEEAIISHLFGSLKTA